ncbi:unnamed protein product, partial [marine sediment metagenome]
TKSPEETPKQPCYVDIGFEKGIPVSLDGEKLDGVMLVQKIHNLAGEYGVGRIDHIENRLVGIKSREVYEAPAATVLLKAHQGAKTETCSLAKKAPIGTPLPNPLASVIISGSTPYC